MAGAVFIADRRLYLNADRSKVLEEGDPAAAYLFVAAGSPINVEDQQAFGLSHDGKVVVLPGAPKPEPKPEPEAKAAAKPADKAVEKAGDK